MKLWYTWSSGFWCMGTNKIFGRNIIIWVLQSGELGFQNFEEVEAEWKESKDDVLLICKESLSNKKSTSLIMSLMAIRENETLRTYHFVGHWTRVG